MEELLAFLLQLGGELLVSLFGEVLLELGWRGVFSVFEKEPHPMLASVGYPILGAAVGALSLWPFPALFVHSHGGRIVNAVVTPVLAGASMAAIGAWRRRRGQRVVLIDRFAYGYLFALAMALVRLKFGH